MDVDAGRWEDFDGEKGNFPVLDGIGAEGEFTEEGKIGFQEVLRVHLSSLSNVYKPSQRGCVLLQPDISRVRSDKVRAWVLERLSF